jgi:P pilus assembly chaperone PapD
MDRKKALELRIGKTWRRIPAFLTFLFFIAVLNSTAGVLVAPTSVILSETKRTGRLTIQNPTDKSKEITIGFAFGLPESDDSGNVKVRLNDTAVSHPRSAVGWIKAFPRKFILEPNATQVVRFLARPPKDLEDGEFWARIMVRSQEGQTSIPVPDDDDKITTKLNMIMQTAIILKYRTGNLISKLDVTDTDISRTDSTVSVLISMANRGNVSYVGVLNCRLLDSDGKEISGNEVDLAVYYNLKRKVELPVTDGIYKKPFKVAITISNEGRADIPEEEMIFGNSIEYTQMVE